MYQIKFVDEANITGRKILLRVDFNVALTDGFTIADDTRIKQSLPTIKNLLKNGNRLILVSHLDQPQTRDPKYSLRIVVDHLHSLLPGYTINLVDDFLSKEGKQQVLRQKPHEILVLENIRFYPQEKENSQEFAKQLSSLAEVYVNDAFAVCHRTDASIVSVPHYLPSYGGLLLKKEATTISKTINEAKKPVVAILGGTKITTKIGLTERLVEIADYLLIGGSIANTFLCAQGIDVGQSYCEYEKVEKARQLLSLADKKNTAIILPRNVVIGERTNSESAGIVKKIEEIPSNGDVLDIGPETQAIFGSIIAKARTIIWNGPVGYFENPAFARGTEFVYYSITQNQDAVSIVGGGETLAAISKEEYLDKITHISTGGGAMLEFIETGTLPGIEALKRQ